MVERPGFAAISDLSVKRVGFFEEVIFGVLPRF
jgi:hypothetical protein